MLQAVVIQIVQDGLEVSRSIGVQRQAVATPRLDVHLYVLCAGIESHFHTLQVVRACAVALADWLIKFGARELTSQPELQRK